MSSFCSRTFSGNRLTLDSNSGRSFLSIVAFCFASSINLERAVALAIRESELDWADWAFEFFFLVKLGNDGGFGGTLSSGIDDKLVVRAMSVV